MECGTCQPGRLKNKCKDRGTGYCAHGRQNAQPASAGNACGTGFCASTGAAGGARARTAAPATASTGAGRARARAVAQTTASTCAGRGARAGTAARPSEEALGWGETPPASYRPLEKAPRGSSSSGGRAGQQGPIGSNAGASPRPTGSRAAVSSWCCGRERGAGSALGRGLREAGPCFFGGELRCLACKEPKNILCLNTLRSAAPRKKGG
jgi:hypothetical protein